ncbi:hypothetical protein PoB_004598700 [Plakobranchus ocellatus]|uniref:Uncharacterized protein n=1 Tax=Plakobranchus ocellatus TaxID=259542 RepID=A0AAV4BJB0_9GAST|nr:hypothetical protein PoB_004598700 [Plakobranchus ocellatus]
MHFAQIHIIGHWQQYNYRLKQVLSSRFRRPTIIDMSGSSGPLTPFTFPTMPSKMASGMHNAFTSPHRQSVLRLTTAFSPQRPVLDLYEQTALTSQLTLLD